MDGYYGRCPDVACRVVDGEAVLVKMPGGVLHVLNPSASRVWLMADGVRSVAKLTRLAGLAEIAGPTEGNDPAAVRAFLRRCVELGLMECASSPADEPEAFPQDANVPPSAEPPAIRASEVVETLAGPSCTIGDFTCGTIS